MAADLGRLIFARGGILFLVRESGRQTKMHLRIKNGTLQLFDHVTRQWVDVPDSIPTTRGTTIHISALEGR